MSSWKNWIPIAILLSSHASSALLAQAPTTASVAGLVTDESARPVPGAFVTLVRTGLPPASGHAASNATGAFLISGLAAGTYSVCAQVPSGGFLDDCIWSESPPTLEVKAGLSITGTQVRLKRGATIQVRVNDPGKFLEPSATKAAPGALLLAVRTTRGLWQPVARVSKDATGANHQVTIPFDTTLPLTVFGPKVSFTDAAGKPVAAGGAEVSLRQASGAAVSAPITFNVAGLKP